MTHKIKEVTHKSYDAPDDSDNDFLCAVQLQRIANSLEEILRLVKADQEKYTAREAREMLQKDD